MRRKKLLFVAIALLTIGLTALGAHTMHELLGRDVALQGEQETLDGVLKLDSGEWFLRTANTDYEMHMGPFGVQAQDILKDGEKAEVRGFVVDQLIAPILIVMGDTEFSVWSENRMPLWAGQGENRHALSEDHEGRGMQQNTEAMAKMRGNTIIDRRMRNSPHTMDDPEATN